MSPVGISLTKLNMDAPVQTFPYPTASKLFLYSNAFMAEQGAQTLTFISVTNRQTDKQTKNSTFLAPRRRVKSSLTKLGMVIEDFKYVPAPLKLLGSDA